MSIRLRLFLVLVAATAAVWVSAVVWIDRSSRTEVERVLDARLVEAARMVSSLLSDHRVALAASGQPVTVAVPPTASYRHELSCQIWTLDGTLVGRSQGAPDTAMAEPRQTGFSDAVIKGEHWRVYTAVNAALGVRVSVGDSVAVRDNLVGGVIRAVLLPAAVVLPVLALLIWFAAAGGLAPLDRLAAQLSARGPADLSPLPEGETPPEIRPVRGALDALLARVRAHRDHERDFIAYAAHELKTPLAGLKMQAQIALRAEDAQTRRHALETLDRSVTRTDRLVRQLLDLARVEQSEEEAHPAEAVEVARSVLAELHPFAARRGVALELAGETGEERAGHRAGGPGEDPRGGVGLRVADGGLLAVILRNLVENALQATPGGGRVVVTPRPWGLDIRDGGSGIPEALSARVFDRFVKGPQADAGEAADASGGSGLGLAIVRQALDRLGGRLEFVREEDGHHARLVLDAVA
ncbi:ATP-binding protein [Acidimangrovimonas sediminis]|uniref:ATP-binding protein n=1 Tax=Acidimangrovimonas sediminis TaxID=2056283 RepID=UPI001304B686|nr:ATP-binding protein [Acidimangrovimonas sediminis]